MSNFFENRKKNGIINQKRKAFPKAQSFMINNYNLMKDEDKIYNDAYLEYFRLQSIRHKWLQFLPGTIINKFIKDEDILMILQNFMGKSKTEYINLKDIYLIKTGNEYEAWLFSNIILDTFTQYLLSLDPNSDNNIYDTLPEGPYEYKNVVLEKGDYVIDAGANIGDFSLLAGIKECKSYAFEPSEMITNKYLKPNIKKNSMSDSIIIAQYALSDKKGEAYFQVPDENMGAGSIIETDKKLDEKEKVQLISLDEYVNENGLPTVDFIKADIEGAERDMLKGAQDVLKEFGPKLALCTYHLPDDLEVMEELILQANSNYIIEHRYKKLYAYVPK